MEVLAEEEQRSGLPAEDPMEAVRRAFPGDDFALRVVSRAFGRPDPPAKRSRQQDTENRASTAEPEPRPDGAPVAPEKPVDLRDAQNAGNSCTQQGASTSSTPVPISSEKNSEVAGNNGGAQPTPTDAGKGATVGWTRRVRLGRVPDERETPPDHVSALEKALTGFAERQTDAVVYPAVGTVFDSLVEAYDFYNIHSWEMGFGVRYGKSRLNAMRSKCMQEIVCVRSGKPKDNMKSSSKSLRCNCTALIRLLRSADKGWYVAQHKETHNHALSKACSDKLSPSHKHIDKFTRDLVRKLRNNNVDLGVYNTIAAFFGRKDNGPVTKGSIRTLCQKINQEQADDAARKNAELTTALGEKDPENHATEEAPINCFDETSSSPDCTEMPVDSLSQFHQEYTERNPDAERVADLMLTFGDCNLVLRSCSYDDLINSSSTMADLEKAINAVKPHLQQGIFGDLWSRAHNSGGVMSAQVLTIKDLFRFERWLTTTTGKHNLQSVQQHIKLVKSGKGVFEPEQTALLRLFQAENDECSREITKLQSDRDAKIAHHQAMIDEARESFEASVESAKMGYPVSSSYVPLSSHELRGQCWSAYLAHCQKESQYMNRGASNIVERFGPEIQQRHLFEFCTQEANRQSLLKYGQTKVEKLKEAQVAHGETSFHGYMTLLDIEHAYALLAAEAQVADDPGTNGGGEGEDRSNRENGVARDESATGTVEENGAEDVLGAPQQKRPRQCQSYVFG